MTWSTCVIHWLTVDPVEVDKRLLPQTRVLPLDTEPPSIELTSTVDFPKGTTRTTVITEEEQLAGPSS